MPRNGLRSVFLFLIPLVPLFSQTGIPNVTSVTNGASGAAAIASGSWVSIYGTNLAATTRSWQASDIRGTALPTTLEGVTVLINGKSAAIAYISPNQINVQAPADTATGPVPVTVINAGGSTYASAILAQYAPGLFSFEGKYAAARHNTDGVPVAPPGFFGGAAVSRGAVPGETLQLFATGLGPTAPAVAPGQTVTTPAPLASLSALRVTVGGVAAAVQYAGLVAPGLYQINATVPPLADGDQAVVASIGGANTQSGISITVKNNVSGSVSVSLSPDGRTLRCGGTLALAVKVNNTTNQLVNWLVGGVAGGNLSVGTVNAAGTYTAPAMLPANPAVTITAVSQQDATAKATITLNLQNPVPVLSSVTPTQLAPGAATLTVSGTGFAKGAVIYLAGTALPTTVISDTKLAAAATIAMPAGRMAALKVTNPNPGAATSLPMALAVRVVGEKMAYADAVRFLTLTTWGATPQAVAELQAMGREAWLAAQFAKEASKWPDPNTATEGVARLQPAFLNIALKGDDQLRQRVAFALAQILVVSANKDTYFQQMVPYQRLMADSAFGSYKKLIRDITLHPSMGDYLDMVNNDKANPTAGTVANENYARELMQLFTIGLDQLNADGVPVTAGGSRVPEYDQTAVAELAKVTTGWTYGQTPGFASLWKNMAYYFAPMVAFVDHHDTTAKTIELPLRCVIPAGGTADADLTAAIDCLFQQTNTAPFVSYRLIQRLVMSDPPPAYVGRVAEVFRSSQGNLQNVITAILTDPAAQAAGSGKLNEPILYATGLLRSLNARITAPDALTAQMTAMGQTPLIPPTVFSYFSPFYTVAGTTPEPVAPEFQAMNASTALARANFAYRTVTNAISTGIVVDLANFTDLAANPADLVEAVNQALFRGEMTSDVRSILMTAANSSTSAAARVRSVLYAAAASPQYQVQQ